MGEEKPALEKAKDLMEVLGKAVVGLLALCYALGLFVVNFYYNRYGVYSLSLIQLNYVVAGVWLLAPIFLTLIILIILIILAYSNQHVRKFINGVLGIKQDEGQTQAADWIGKSAVGAACLTILMVIIALQEIRITFVYQWIVVLLTAFFLNLFMSVTLYVFFRYRSTLRFPLLFSMLTIYVAFLTAYTFDFSKSLYGTIPPHLGGGGTKDVQLLLDVDESSKKYFELSGLEFYENTNQTKTARLLFVTDDDYIFLVKPP